MLELFFALKPLLEMKVFIAISDVKFRREILAFVMHYVKKDSKVLIELPILNNTYIHSLNRYVFFLLCPFCCGFYRCKIKQVKNLLHGTMITIDS